MEADRGRTPDSTPDRDLRRDIRRVTSILGETLARTEGDDLLALVEQVRAHAKEGRLDQLRRLRPGDHHSSGARVHGVLPPREHHRAGPPRPRPDPRRRRGGRLARAGCRTHRGVRGSTPTRSRRCSSRSPCVPSSPPTRPRSPDARRSTSCVASQPCWRSPTIRVGRAGSKRRSSCCGSPTRSDWSSPSRPTRLATSSTTSRACRPAPCPTSSRSCATGSCGSGSTCPRTYVRSASAPGSVATATATLTSLRRPRARC